MIEGRLILDWSTDKSFKFAGFTAKRLLASLVASRKCGALASANYQKWVIKKPNLNLQLLPRLFPKIDVIDSIKGS